MADIDGDEIGFVTDNCPTIGNPGKEDKDEGWSGRLL